MAWYLKFPADSGNAVTNNKLVQITGITGTLATVRYTLAEAMPAYITGRTRYVFDIRRLPNSTTDGGGVGYILQAGISTFETSGTSSHKVNGSAVTVDYFLNGGAPANSVCEFNVGSVPSSGCIAFGARFNEVEHCYNLAIKNIVIIDGAGTHTIDMSSSGGASNEFTSTDGALTLKLFNFTGTAHWVFYSSGATYQLTAQGGTFSYSGSSAALNRGYKLAAQGATYTYTGASANLTYNVATVYRMDALGASYSYAGASASLLRGFKLSASGGTYSYSGASATLTKSGPMIYRLTALGVTYVYSGGDARLTATGVIPVANPAAFVNRAYVGGRLVNNAKIGGSLTNNATVAI